MTVAVSVIVPTRDRPDLLRQALASVAAQEYRDVEVVVVNDGGADVEAAVSPLRAELAIWVLDLPSSLGPSAARNAGIDRAQGRYLAFLDDDDLYRSHHLRAAVTLLDAGKADLVYATSAVSAVRLGPEQADGWDGDVAFDLPHRDGLLEVTNYIPTSAVVCRAGPARFDPHLRVQEDWDMWLRLIHEHGFRVAHLPEPGLIYHRIADAESATSAILADIEVHRLFHTTYQKMIARWPVPAGSPSQRYRDWMLHVYQLIFNLMERGGRLDVHWYERVLWTLHDGFTGTLPEDRLPAHLAAAVAPEAGRGTVGGRGTGRVGGDRGAVGAG
nr:glycosyltransferase family 2 protein [Micromonospora sp. DSM 115978]